MTSIVTADRVGEDHGTVVLFHGTTGDEVKVTFAVDHRMAAGLAERLADGPVDCEVEPYQIIGVSSWQADRIQPEVK